MGKETTSTGQSVSSTSTEAFHRTSAASRYLGGATFLTLEHIGYFALVVLLPIILLSGFTNAVSLWSNGSSTSRSTTDLIATSFGASTTTAVMVCAVLLVLTPLMYVLRRRVSAEYAKRPGYTDRVAYKLPVYTALAVLSGLAVWSFVGMVNVFVGSLVNIGVSGVNIGDMYLHQFLPALLSLVVFGLGAGYLVMFAKARDMSRLFVGLASLLAGVMIVALFVTALTINHQPTSSKTTPQTYPYPTSTPDYSEYLNY
jgi:hypothetical protein